MAIDPLAKKVQQEKRREAQKLAARKRYAAAKVLKAGSLTKTEKAVVAAVSQQDTPLVPAQVTALATVLQRKPATIRKSIQQAREEFQSAAMDYVKAHKAVLTAGDPDVARKAAQWAIEHLSHRDKDGNVERVVEAVDSADERPQIQIGIQLGGIPRGSQPSVDAELVEED